MFLYMKEIRIALEDKEHEKLLKQKGEFTWKQFLMNGDRDEREGKQNKSNKARDD